MRELRISFDSNGQHLKKVAMFKTFGNQPELSKSKRNEAVDVQMEFDVEGYWSITFEGEAGTLYEIELVYDKENRQPTVTPIKAITWQNDVITDVQQAEVKIR